MNMVRKTNLIRVIFAALLGGVWPAPAFGAGSLDALTEDSPFLPREGAANNGGSAGAGSALEFRGVLESGGEIFAGIFDRASGLSFWVRVGGETEGATAADDVAAEVLTASNYDPQDNRLRVNFQGHGFTLELARAFIGETPSGSASAEGESVTEALAATLEAADGEQDFSGIENSGRRLITLRVGAAPRLMPRDDGNTQEFASVGTRNRTLVTPPVQSPTDTPVFAEPFAEVTATFADTVPDGTGLALAVADSWAGLADDDLLPIGDDGGRRLLIRHRVGQASSARRLD